LKNDMISRFAFLFFDSRKIDWLDGGRKIWNWFLFSSFFFFFFVLFPARSSCACRKCVFLLHLIAYFRLIGYWGGDPDWRHPPFSDVGGPCVYIEERYQVLWS
jgi:hypothetical protein